MNAPGSPSSPLQMTYFVSPGCCADHAPFLSGRETRAAAPAQAGLLDGGNNFVLFRDSAFRFAAFVRHFRQRLKPSVRQIFVEVKRIELAEMFRGDVDLLVEKRAHGRVAFAHRKTLDAAFLAGSPNSRARQAHAPRCGWRAETNLAERKCCCNKSPSLGRRERRVKRARLTRRRHFNHRRAMAHAHATDALYRHIDATGRCAFAQRME